MINEIFRVVSLVFVFFLGLFTTAQGTWLDNFFRWLGLGSLIDFIIKNNPIIITFAVVVFLYQWIKDLRILAGIGIVIWLFLAFAL